MCLVRTEATAFDLTCVDCELTLTVDLAVGDWRDQLNRFDETHHKHEQKIIQIPQQRDPA